LVHGDFVVRLVHGDFVVRLVHADFVVRLVHADFVVRLATGYFGLYLWANRPFMHEKTFQIFHSNCGKQNIASVVLLKNTEIRQ
jgi:hypothetical protein